MNKSIIYFLLTLSLFGMRQRQVGSSGGARKRARISQQRDENRLALQIPFAYAEHPKQYLDLNDEDMIEQESFRALQQDQYDRGYAFIVARTETIVGGEPVVRYYHAASINRVLFGNNLIGASLADRDQVDTLAIQARGQDDQVGALLDAWEIDPHFIRKVDAYNRQQFSRIDYYIIHPSEQALQFIGSLTDIMTFSSDPYNQLALSMLLANYDDDPNTRARNAYYAAQVFLAGAHVAQNHTLGIYYLDAAINDAQEADLIASVKNLRAAMYFGSGDYARAKDLYDQVVILDDAPLVERQRAALEIAKLLQEGVDGIEKDEARAQELYRVAIADANEDADQESQAEAAYRLGVLLQKRGDSKQAKEYLRRAQAINPLDHIADLATGLLDAMELQEVESAYNQAFAGDNAEEQAAAAYNLGRVILRVRHDDEETAREYLDQAARFGNNYQGSRDAQQLLDYLDNVLSLPSSEFGD